MPSLDGFFRRISSLLPASLKPDLDALARLNPEKIYVENVRAALRVSSTRAERICETAVRQGVFVRGVDVLCPDDTVGATVLAEAPVPELVRCWTETDGEVEEEWVATAGLRRIPFYRLNGQAV